MPLNILVCVKQVLDPETPPSALRLNREKKRMESPPNIPPVVNGFDENAVEAALRLKDAQGGKVTVISAGKDFVLDVVKKPLSMGADELVLIKDDALEGADPYTTAQVLAAAVRRIGDYDLILCGRQASDFDQAQVPLALAELLGLPAITVARGVEVKDGRVVVERVIPDGVEVAEAPLPAVVTVSNELGQPRYPNLRMIMMAARKQPTYWSLADLGLDPSSLQPVVQVVDLFVPTSEKQCEFIEGETEEEKGRNLARKLREAKLI